MKSKSSMPVVGRTKLPENIAFGVDDVPPPVVIILSALQHVAIVVSIGVIFPLLVLQQIEVSAEERARVISASMLALGIGTLVQCWRGRIVGSGYLAPVVFTAAYLPANLIAAEVGGLPLVAGMTVLAGLLEMAIGAGILWLRPYVPTEVAGFAVMMIGVVLGMLGFDLVFVQASAVPHTVPAAAAASSLSVEAALAISALAVMAAASVWGKGKLRLYSVLVGIVFGYVAGMLVGVVDLPELLRGITSPPQVPSLPPRPAVAIDLVIPYAVGAVACALRALGDITTCQKINDVAWTRPNMQSIRAGLVADGLGTAIAGAIGSVGLNTFSGSIALSAAVGVTSRVVGYAVAALFVAMAFVPSVQAIALVPKPVMGATLIFSGSFIIFNGIQIVVTRLLDNRKILVIGVSLILGLSNYAFPTLYAALPGYVQPLTSSPFVLAIASALVLNAVFRIGIRNRASLTYDPRGEPTDVLVDFLSHQGAAWGARRDVIQRVTSALVEFSEHLREFSPEGAKATLSLAFDESSVAADVAYDGAPLLLPKQPSGAKPVADLESIPSDLCGLIISRLADRARTSTRDGRPMLHLTFLH